MAEKLNTDILVIGAGLTGLTMAYYLKKAGRKVIVAESSGTTGGVIRTITEDGFTYETGPNTGVLSTPEIAELFEDLEEEVTLEIPSAAARSRWIWKEGRWHALPSGLIPAVTTPLFTMSDKVRILAEPFRRRGKDPDETVAGLVKRRLGASFLDFAVDPFISGIYAGDPDRLITRHALPKLYNLEQEYGSFIRGAVKKKFAAKEERDRKATREVFSVKGGLQRLTDALSAAIGSADILLDCRQISVQPGPGKFTAEITTEAPSKKLQVVSSHVISTVGSHALPGIMRFLSPRELQPLMDLEYAKVVQVAAGFSHWDGMSLDAFGGLIPSREKRNALGILFPSSIFEGRAPRNGALLSVFLGGMRNPGMITKSDEEISTLAREEIRETLQAVKAPDLVRIFRYQHAIPQYERSTEKRLDTIAGLQSAYPGLILAGNIRDGIGMADRVKQARKIADSLSSNG